MSNSNTEVKEVKGEITVAGKKYPLTSVKYLIQVNSWPTIHAETLVKPVEGGKDTSVVDINGSLFQELKSIKDTKDNVTLTYGVDDQTTSISCIVKSVAMNIGVDSVAITITLSPNYVKLDKLNLSLYKYINKILDIDAGKDKLSISKEKGQEDQLMTYFKRVVETLRDAWKAKKDDVLKGRPEVMKKSIDSIHDNNEDVIKYFLELLGNSQATVGNLYDLANNYDSNDFNVAQQLKNIIQAEKGSFLSIITDIGSALGLIYVPGIDSEDVGKFIPMHNLLEGDISQADLKIVNATANIGSLGIPQLGCVFAQGKAQEDLDAAELVKFVIEGCASWPPDIPKGSKDTCIQASRFIIQPSYIKVQPSDITTGDTTTLDGKQRTGGIDAYKWMSNVTSVLQTWCKQKYSFQKASTSIANVDSFYQAGPELFGKIVQFKDNNNVPMFTGFVSSYEQYIRKDTGSNGVAVTKFQLVGVQL